jgi:hypothetical protein
VRIARRAASRWCLADGRAVTVHRKTGTAAINAAAAVHDRILNNIQLSDLAAKWSVGAAAYADRNERACATSAP